MYPYACCCHTVSAASLRAIPRWRSDTNRLTRLRYELTLLDHHIKQDQVTSPTQLTLLLV